MVIVTLLFTLLLPTIKCMEEGTKKIKPLKTLIFQDKMYNNYARIAWSPNREEIAFFKSNNCKHIYIWNILSNKKHKFSFQKFKGLYEYISNIFWIYTNQLLIVTNNKTLLYNLKTNSGQVIAQYRNLSEAVYKKTTDTLYFTQADTKRGIAKICSLHVLPYINDHNYIYHPKGIETLFCFQKQNMNIFNMNYNEHTKNLFIYYCDSTCYLINTMNSKISELNPLPNEITDAKRFTYEGVKYFITITDDWQFILRNVKTNKVQNITTKDDDCCNYNFDISPNGKHIAYFTKKKGTKTALTIKIYDHVKHEIKKQIAIDSKPWKIGDIRYSSCGNFLAISTKKGIYVYESFGDNCKT